MNTLSQGAFAQGASQAVQGSGPIGTGIAHRTGRADRGTAATTLALMGLDLDAAARGADGPVGQTAIQRWQPLSPWTLWAQSPGGRPKNRGLS